jgi:N-acetylmuramoyl-L-alanine amidase
MPACLVEMAFIVNEEDAALLKYHHDDFARAIACGVTDYEQSIS